MCDRLNHTYTQPLPDYITFLFTSVIMRTFRSELNSHLFYVFLVSLISSIFLFTSVKMRTFSSEHKFALIFSLINFIYF